MTPNLEKSLTRVQKELDVLYEVSCAMRTTLELNHVLYIILTGVTSHSGLGYNRGLLFLLNEQKNTLECKMAIGPESGEDASKIWNYIENSQQGMDDLIKAERIEKAINQSQLYQSIKKFKVSLENDSSNLLKSAFERGVPWHIPQELIAAYAEDPLFQHLRTEEVLIMPLRAKDAVNGLIVVDNIFTKKPITEEDIKIFSMLTDQAGLAIENSRLYEIVVQKSLTDPITELWNHRFFQEKLAEELAMATEHKRSLSLAMIDIDNFKRLNDTYGHQEGDAILKELARILKELSRDKDYVCRYGGEEFSVILVETSKDQGAIIAERFRKRIAEHPFSTTKQTTPIHLTVSIGVAGLPEDGPDKEDLISYADKAMYIAKFSGKNKTCLAQDEGEHTSPA